MAEYKFKRTGAQMDALFDEVAEGGKIYQTTLFFSSIERREDKSMTEEEWLEVNNIISKYKAGYVVTIADSRDYPFRYGVINVTMMDDAVPVTLSVFNDQGDLMAYSVDGLSPGNLWIITNKTQGGGGGTSKICQFTTPNLLYEGRDAIELSSSDSLIIQRLYEDNENMNTEGFTYFGTDLNGLLISTPFILFLDLSLSVPVLNIRCLDLLEFNIQKDEFGRYIASEITRKMFGRYKIAPYPSVNTSTKSIEFVSGSTRIGAWYVLSLNFTVIISGNQYTCSASMPINIPESSNTYYTQAFIDKDPLIPVKIKVTNSSITAVIVTKDTISGIIAPYSTTYLVEI